MTLIERDVEAISAPVYFNEFVLIAYNSEQVIMIKDVASHKFLVFVEEKHSLFLSLSLSLHRNLTEICILDCGIVKEKLYVLSNAI